MFKTFKFRLWVNVNQKRELNIMLETHRRLYNECLEQRISSYEANHNRVNYKDQSAWFTKEKRVNPWYAKINAGSAQQTMRRLEKAFQSFFRRIKAGRIPGHPRFKSQRSFKAFSYATHGDGIRITTSKLRIQHVGVVRVKLHRPLEGKIKQLHILKENDEWYVVIVCELENQSSQTENNYEIGIDVGIAKFLTTSEGEAVANPNLLKSSLPELRRAQRKVSRKKKGGSNRRKAQRRVRRLHNKIKNQRADFHWKTANKLVRENGKIAVESLNVQRMLECGNRRLALQIADAGWSSFLSKLKSKAESAGVLVVEVNCRGTSQRCHRCGTEVPKTLRDRWHSCPHCLLEMDRDHNSACEVLRLGRLAWAGPADVNIGVG